MKNNLDGISQKVLTQSLRSMEDDGLIIRREIKRASPKAVESCCEFYAIRCAAWQQAALSAIWAYSALKTHLSISPPSKKFRAVCILPAFTAIFLLYFLPVYYAY
ncbi:winged helix-turn-helix transcriptional regulator [Treponema sp.]|uniref:winged helix-turn-helix transcriptional regulator n=1 Tax=Treponema sp. TaxID=166 RepID=UPI003FA20C71